MNRFKMSVLAGGRGEGRENNLHEILFTLNFIHAIVIGMRLLIKL